MNILKKLLDLPKDTMLDVRHGIEGSAVTGFTVGDLMDEVHEYAEDFAKGRVAKIHPRSGGLPPQHWVDHEELGGYWCSGHEAADCFELSRSYGGTD